MLAGFRVRSVLSPNVTRVKGLGAVTGSLGVCMVSHGSGAETRIISVPSKTR